MSTRLCHEPEGVVSTGTVQAKTERFSAKVHVILGPCHLGHECQPASGNRSGVEKRSGGG